MPDDAPETTDLVRTSDPYEQEFMGAGELVLHRDKVANSGWMHALMAFVTVAGIVGVIGSGAPIAVALLPLLVGFMAWLSIATLRTTVTAENVYIQMGIIGPTIPVDSIVSAKAVDYSWVKYGGWGVRFSIFDGSIAYNVMSDKGKAVEIEYKKGNKIKKVLVSSHQNALLADAIQRAMAGELESDFEQEVALDFGEENVEFQINEEREQHH